MAKKVCPSCKAEIKEGIKFCPKCGIDIENFKKVDNSKDKEENVENKNVVLDEEKQLNEEIKVTEKPKKKNKVVIVSIVLMLILALVGVLLWILVFNKYDESSNPENGNDEIVENDNEEEKEEENKDEDEEENKDDEVEDDNDNDNPIDNPEVPEFKYYGNTYVYSEGLAWLKDSSYIYLVNEEGKIINKFDGKNYDGYYNFQNSNFRDGYAMIGNDLYNDKGELVEFDFEYESVNYYGDGLAVITTKEEDYKGTTIKRGIYDLDNKKYIFDLNETVYSISSLGEEMYLIYFNQDNRYVVYDARTNNSFYLGDRFDVLQTQYKDGYIIFQNINAKEVYALDRVGNKTLIANDRKYAQIGQYSDGLVFIGDAFYDINGTKVIDLKDEGVSNKPKFVNGYALVFFETGYFTVLSKETKEYMFEPKAYTSMDNTYNGSFELGLYEDQSVISNSGHLIVRLYDDVLRTKNWAIMDVNGELVYQFSEAISIKTVIAENGYIGVSDSSGNESYYVSVNGEKLKISE